MRFKDYFYEGVTPQAQAYWISPAGESIPVIMTHIDTVLKNPARFNLTQEYIDKVAEENGGVGELRDGGKARDVIMTEMLKDGWVRIRKVTKPYEFWTIQIENLSRTVKRNIIKWVDEMSKMNEHRLKDTVVVLDTKGNRLFGGSSNFREQKTLKDIYLDDTGVFESIFEKGEPILEYAESKMGLKITYNLVKLNETTLEKMLSTHSDAGYIVISAWRSENSEEENNIANKKLKFHLDNNIPYSYYPVWGGYVETDRITGELKEVKEKSYVIANFMKGKNTPLTSSESLKDLGMKLADEYKQETFLYKPTGETKDAMYITPTGEIAMHFTSVTPTQSAHEYFTNLRKSRKKSKDSGKSLTYEGVIYMAQAPNSVSEAIKRYGECFFRL